MCASGSSKLFDKLLYKFTYSAGCTSSGFRCQIGFVVFCLSHSRYLIFFVVFVSTSVELFSSISSIVGVFSSSSLSSVSFSVVVVSSPSFSFSTHNMIGCEMNAVCLPIISVILLSSIYSLHSSFNCSTIHVPCFCTRLSFSSHSVTSRIVYDAPASDDHTYISVESTCLV